MKKSIKLISLGVLASLGLASCSDTFLEEKRNYDNATKDIYNYFSGANGRVNDIYSWSLPAVSGMTWQYPSMGNADGCSQSTEEYTGFSSFLNPESDMEYAPDYFMGDVSNIQASVYGRIRNINDAIIGISGSTLSQSDKNLLLGQVYFFRAWCYYLLVKWYGGVPLVEGTPDPLETSVTPRSSLKACIDYIINDLDKSAEMLAEHTTNGGWSSSDYGRVTSGTALALKGRVLLWWCSPLFNRKNDQSRWAEAYETMTKELPTINACGYGLYQTGNNVNGSDFAAQFLTSNKNPEAVFVTLYNNIASEETLDNQKNNGWESSIRPRNTTGQGSGKRASRMMIDLFPMKDGKVPSTANTYSKLEHSSIAYDANYPFMDRDPRFYRTFAFPGFRWAYNGDASLRDPNNPSDGANYVLWNYVWYQNQDEQNNRENSGAAYAANNLLTSNTSVYVRKKSDDLDVNSSPLYNYSILNSKGAYPFYSAAPLIELRYTEVLMNLAEVACGAGHMNEAVKYLKMIRERAGYKADNNYGLQSNLESDQAACMSAILYERQIEFAYEGKRFDDMRRWMLFDGGAVKVEGAPESWTLEGWGGNTCEWLGFTKFNGQRRENVYFAVNSEKYGFGGTTYDSDPLVKAGVQPCPGVDFRKEDIDSQLATLKQWYEDNLITVEKYGDDTNSQHLPLYIDFKAKYYILGLSSGAQDNNKTLPQTIGWKDKYNGNALGQFDPFDENAPGVR